MALVTPAFLAVTDAFTTTGAATVARPASAEGDLLVLTGMGSGQEDFAITDDPTWSNGTSAGRVHFKRVTAGEQATYDIAFAGTPPRGRVVMLAYTMGSPGLPVDNVQGNFTGSSMTSTTLFGSGVHPGDVELVLFMVDGSTAIAAGDSWGSPSPALTDRRTVAEVMPIYAGDVVLGAGAEGPWSSTHADPTFGVSTSSHQMRLVALPGPVTPAGWVVG